ncbi:MAG: arsenite methyltransferase [Gammaproteobacteria bacterium]|nr:arsenite methyltransferase [Gammaproteobacteria bacterium]MDH3374109.1 arsenite methyltransferase [Gammaproteobacteria bacterium]MDH3409221.1 arsenite methyltransferase [Gammaproteobacteria bacterium]MDH3552465.1 arsenite methyltransferase [Gammaproteobacteria bacterium]
MEEAQTHTVVREGYARVAKQKTSCCGPTGHHTTTEIDIAKQIGYSDADLAGPAATGNLGLGCGNPTAIANLQPGEIVVDLGSGAGFDALLAAEKLGSNGRFIGVDMTPEMLARARTNAVNAGYARTVEFREGLIEALPVASGSADVVISNCVINLSPDKATVFREAFRVLRSGGRLAISDILLTEPLPPEVAKSVTALIACVAGAETEEVYVGHIRDAGFVDIELQRRLAGEIFDFATDDPVISAAIAEFGVERAKQIAETVFSYTIQATKP